MQLFGKKFKVVQEITGYCLALICLFLDVSTTYANGENLGYDFQNHFSVSKMGRIFPKKISLKNICLGDQLLPKNVFENFDF